MKFFAQKVVSKRIFHTYPFPYLCAIIFQLIVCYTTDCKTFHLNNNIISAEKFGSNRQLLNTLLSDLNNITLKSSLQIDEELLKNLPIRPGMVQFSVEKPYTLPKPLIVKRSKRRSGLNGRYTSELVQDVCPSVSDWVARPEALDPYGNKLTIVQRIPINGTVINQYFYETFCAHNFDFGYESKRQNYMSSQCRGIDKELWSSRCRETYIWTYGRVMTSNGEVGWSVIAIRGACGCAIWPRSDEVNIGRGRRVIAKTEDNIKDNIEDNNLYKDPFF